MSARGGPTPRGLGVVVAAAAALVVLWLVRPWFHGIALAFVARPSLAVSLLVLAVGFAAAVRLAGPEVSALDLLSLFRNGEADPERFASLSSGRMLVVGAVVLVAVLAALALPVFGSAYAQVHTAHTLDVTGANHLPEIDASAPRILPRSVATEYAANSLQFPRYRIAAGDIAVRDGRPAWSFGLAPDGALNRLLLVGRGAVFVDMTTTEKRVNVVEADQQVGFGYGLSGGKGLVSNYRWRLEKRQFLVNYEDPIMVEHGGSLYMAVPYVAYDHHVRFTPLPTVYATPRWGGVALVAENGSVQFLSPAEAQSNPVLAGQRLFPFDLARYDVSSMRYRRGILNKWFVHEGELEIAPVPGEGNDQPFLVMTRDRGIQYFVAAEPYGNAQGIYQIWMIDGRSGDVSRYQLPMDSALTGPRKAANYVRKANDRTDWGRFAPSEPVPAVVNGTLYWQVKVVPQDASGIAYTAFVDAGSGDVYTIRTDDGIRAFLRGSAPGAGQTGGTGGPAGGTGGTGGGNAIVVSVKDRNGTVVDTVTVQPGQSVEISYPNGSATGAGGRTPTPGGNATATATP